MRKNLINDLEKASSNVHLRLSTHFECDVIDEAILLIKKQDRLLKDIVESGEIPLAYTHPLVLRANELINPK